MSAQLFPALLEQAAGRHGSAIALREKQGGLWRQWSWAEMARAVSARAGALAARGLGPGDVLAVIGDGRADWLITERAALSLGVAVLALAGDLDPAIAADRLQRSGARAALACDMAALELLVGLAGDRPALLIDASGPTPKPEAAAAGIVHVDALGAGTAPAGRIGPDDPALLNAADGDITVITHGRLASLAEGSPLQPGDDLMSALAPAYLAERIAVGYWPLTCGATVSFAENRETVGDDLIELRPTVVVGPPRLWKRLALAITLASEDATPFQRWMLARALGDGAMPLRGWLKGRLRSRIGLDRARLLVNLGAPLGPGLAGWYRTIGRPVTDAKALAPMGLPAEAALRDSLLIHDALLVGPGTAILAAEAEPVARFVRRAGVEAVTDQSAFDTPAVHALILDEVRRINAGLPPDQRLTELRLLRESISLDHPLVGPDALIARSLADQVQADDVAILKA